VIFSNDKSIPYERGPEITFGPELGGAYENDAWYLLVRRSLQSTIRDFVTDRSHPQSFAVIIGCLAIMWRISNQTGITIW
jgi:hypothetical protein